MLKKIFLYLQTQFFSRIYIDTNTDYHHTILLSSLGRSGSTLISNLVNYKNDYRIIFEPFKYDTVNIAKDFVYPFYIPPDNKNEALLKSLDIIVTGKIRTAWTDKDNKKVIAGDRLIKDIRTNLLLNWIRSVYPDLPIILLIRNPFSVIESWMRAEWLPDRPYKRLLEQEHIISPLLPKNVFNLFKSSGSSLEKNFYVWCINNYIPLQKAKENNYHITFYENYFSNPENEVRGLFHYLNMPFDPIALKQLNYFSRTTSKDSPIRTGQNILQSWKSKFNEAEIESGIKILSLFQLDRLFKF